MSKVKVNDKPYTLRLYHRPPPIHLLGLTGGVLSQVLRGAFLRTGGGGDSSAGGGRAGNSTEKEEE